MIFALWQTNFSRQMKETLFQIITNSFVSLHRKAKREREETFFLLIGVKPFERWWLYEKERNSIHKFQTHFFERANKKEIDTFA